MRVAFLSLKAKEPLTYGVMSLASTLRRAGHAVQLVQGSNVERIASDPLTIAADVLAMSATTGLHRVYLRWARELRTKYSDKAIVIGGPHATFFPHMIEQAPIDGVCIGEGEESFPEFIDLWRTGFPSVPDGFWIRRNNGRGPVERGRTRSPVRDLDSLPLPAFDLYYDLHRRYRALPIRIFMATRGCPFNCSYCFNREINRRNRPFGTLLRAHDPERLADDIIEVRKRWGMRLVWFLDANFAANRRWLEAFTRVFPRRVGLPFFCKLRPERATEKTVKMLVQAGCTAVGVGIESGSERLRRDVLQRNGSDAAIIEGCRRLKAAGLRVLSFNMLGVPGETVDDALKTVDLNITCGVDYAAATILQPYPGTEIARWATENGYFDGNFERLSYSYFAESPFRFACSRDRDRITNLQRLFSFAVEFPEVRKRIRRLIDRPPNRFLQYLFQGRHDWAVRHTFYRAFERTDTNRTGLFTRL